MDLNIKTSDIERTFMKDRVNNIEKHFTGISSKLSSYINQLANLRDCGDEVAKTILQFSSKEHYNQTLRLKLSAFTDVLHSIQEYREAQIQRTHVKVIREIEGYKDLCKTTKTDLKRCFDSRMKQLKKEKELEKARSKKSTNWQKIAEVEQEVVQARQDAARMTQELMRLVEWFERKKLEDLKNAFLELAKIELIFHAKAIELYSKGYNILKEIDVDQDLDEFNSYFLAHFSPSEVNAIHSPKNTTTTTPKVLDTSSEIPPHFLHKPGTSKGMQGTSRSVFTLKATTTANPDKSDSSYESSTDPTGLN